MTDGFKLLFRLYVRPGAAISGILDRGSLLFASVVVLVVSYVLGRALAFPFYFPLLILAVFYVPGLLLLSRPVAALGGAGGGTFARDYSPLFACIAMAWAAANLPLAVLLWLHIGALFPQFAAVVYIWFLVLVFFAVRTVFGAGNGVAAGIVMLSWLPLVAAFFLWGPLQFILGWIASPFFLFFAWYYLGGELGHLGDGWRRRQNFHKMLEAATVNPHDGEAQYQLGLIYEERRQTSEAIERFRNAVAIDPAETGAHFELGKIARQQGRLQDALAHFQTVIDQDADHHQGEILRELGAVYLNAGQFGDAYHELALYTERRPYDPEGLFYCGEALGAMGRSAEARGMYERAIEAVRTAPRYRARAIAQWSRLAQRRLRKLA